jgi:hypothetical protein
MEINQNSHPKIDTVFQKIAEAQSSAEDEAAALWENGFKTKVAQQNFWRLGFGPHNGLTLGSVVLTTVVVVAITFVSYRALNHPSTDYSPIHKEEVNRETNESPSPIINSESIDPNSSKVAAANVRANSKNGNDQPNTTAEGIIVPADSSTSVVEINQSVPATENKSTENITTEPVHVVKTPLIKKEKRTVVIEKRDTLHAVDTIRSKREWKKIIKNKE